MDTEGYTAFIRYILDKEDYRPIAWHRAYESLRSHPTQLSCLTTNTPEHQKFIHGFDEYAGRLCRFLNRIPQFLGRDSKAFEKMKNIGDIITEHLISVLISPSFSHLRNRESLFDLTVSTLEIAHPEHLGRIAALLCDRPAFLGKIISCERSSHFLLPWIRVLCIQHPNAVTLKSWTEVVASSCMACIGNHGLQTTLEEWEEIRAAALLHTNIQVTASILTKLCSSMPCRLCFTRFSDSPSQASFVPTATYPATHLSAGQQSASVIGTDVLDRQDPLIGDDLGLWKILLSGQALKDLETSKSKGNFESVWAKLEDLSTGDWVRKSVARPFPNPLKFKVRLFFASYGSNGRILWQVDSAYNPRYHAQSQVVRVWRIGDWKEISDAAETVAKTQRHWNAARVARCKVNKVDKVNGIKVPEFFPSIDDDLPHPVPQSNPPEEKEINLNLLITSKFHTLTTCIFDNIFRYQNEDAVFPFDLSSTEVAIIKHSETAAFILGRSGTGKTTCLLYKLLSRYLASRVDEDKDYVRQVLVTRSKTLAEKLHTELHALIRAQLINEVENQNPSIEDEPDRWDGTSEETTKSLFTLKRNGFPLVCTFTYFLKLVENTIRENDRQNFAIADRSSIGDFVDFQFFKAVYWPKFRYTRAIGRHLEANLVFSEIMGVIKGAASMQNGLKPLSRDEYITRSSSLAPAFPTTAEREVLFDLYSQYESSKRQHGHHDAMDRMISILHSITSNGLTKTLRNIVQEIYVDEVQDQRPLELELFLHIIQDPRGIHFAGDSAQCISNDSAFRFNNIKALFFEHYSKADPQLAKPMLFKLSRNYRSHQGILSFASFVMNLLWKGFPTMVDKLSPEIGQVTGPKPIFFVGAKVTELLVQVSTLTYIGNNQPQEATSISSNKQVVIVRDDGTRSHLKSLLGSNRIVYTILESKGMEYDDVFLYNFFQSSPCSAEMRTLEQLLPEGVNHSYAANNMIICSELRNLYVAVTRPRNRLWILESSTPSMLDLLSKLQEPLVDVQNIDHCNLPRLADTLRPITCTTTEDWNRTGRQCMDNELFDRALQCFENAGDERNIKWANACIFEQTGRELRANWELHSFRRSFKEAAKLFRELEMLEKAAGCLEALGEYVEAANLWSTKKHHERAAGLFEKAGVLYVEKAAEEYYAAGLPSRALSALYKAKHYESVIEGLTRHMGGDSIDNAERKSYATGCNLHARQPDTTIGSHLLEKAFNLFKTPEEKKEFLESFGFYEELLQFCISRGEYQDGIARLVLAGRLEDVLEFSLQRDAAWSWLPSSDEFLSEIYRSIKAEKLMEALDASKVLPESVISTGGKFATVPWVKQWDKQLSICHDILLTQRIPNKQELPNQGTIDLMSLLLLIKPEYFLKSTAGLSQFTCMLEYLEDYMQYLKPVTGQFPMFPDSTISCLGLLNLPWSLERTYYCASWSVLRKVKALQPASKEFGPRVLIEAHHYLAALVPKTVDKILSRANGSPTLMILNPCSKCVSQACWAPPHRPFTCRNHQLMSSWGFLEQFKVRCELRKTCSSYKLLPSDSILAKGSDLNDQLRFFFSYQSAFSQDAAVIGQACSRILKEGHYRLLLDRLKVLSINLVREEITRLEEVPEKNGAVRWNEGNLSTLMNGCRLMRMFGSDAFVEEPVLDIEHSVAYTLRPFRYYHKLKSLKDRGLHFQFTDIVSLQKLVLL
ncbi:hypothetical protein BDZ91DRAFT_305427 [Kalaharituber pfeilii]|nr:hypothetical protein BDZ91DRAFT_305427 [Kalaharituber pfeilii]